MGDPKWYHRHLRRIEQQKHQVDGLHIGWALGPGYRKDIYPIHITGIFRANANAVHYNKRSLPVTSLIRDIGAGPMPSTVVVPDSTSVNPLK